MTKRMGVTEGPARATFLRLLEEWPNLDHDRIRMESEKRKNVFQAEDVFQKALQKRVCELLLKLKADKGGKAFPRRDYKKLADFILVSE
jgi:hypothetical protein